MSVNRPSASRLLALLAILAGAAAPLAAQPPAAEDGLRWSLGLGVISAPRPYVGADNQTRVIPLLDLEYRRFYFRGIVAGYRMFERGPFRLEATGRARFSGYEADDSSFLTGMEERRETFELGLNAAWELGSYEIVASVAADALGRSDGVQAGLELGWGKVYGRGRAGLFPSLGLVWQNADFVDYYAGVRPAEARPGRPAYEGRSAVNLGAGLRGFWRLTERARLIGLVRAERLAGEYVDSPIIDSRWGTFGLVAIAYEL